MYAPVYAEISVAGTQHTMILVVSNYVAEAVNRYSQNRATSKRKLCEVKRILYCLVVYRVIIASMLYHHYLRWSCYHDISKLPVVFVIGTRLGAAAGWYPIQHFPWTPVRISH